MKIGESIRCPYLIFTLRIKEWPLLETIFTIINSNHHLSPTTLKPCPQFTCFLNPSRDSHSTTPLGILFQWFVKKCFPNIWTNLVLVQLQAMSSHPVTCYLGQEANAHLATIFLQVVVGSGEVSPQSLVLQGKQFQLPLSLLIGLLLQIIHPLWTCPMSFL